MASDERPPPPIRARYADLPDPGSPTSTTIRIQPKKKIGLGNRHRPRGSPPAGGLFAVAFAVSGFGGTAFRTALGLGRRCWRWSRLRRFPGGLLLRRLLRGFLGYLL